MTTDQEKRADKKQLHSITTIHHTEGLVDPNRLEYPRACRFRKYQIENRLCELHLPTFFKNVSKIGNNWQQLTDFQTFFGNFHVFQVVEHTPAPDSLRKITFKNETFQKKSKNSNFGNYCQF
jgi:hypothetical protein